MDHHGPPPKTNKYVLGQIKLEFSLEAKMTKLRLSYFGRIVGGQESQEKKIMLGKIEGGGWVGGWE